ncbi:MAG: hypothetical protein MUD10_03805 [Candidatus Pacebacteria bacterium]|jgi:hypothetical protein|nr:hypothetical protein [Candidatus Paceibacterota bacterium]
MKKQKSITVATAVAAAFILGATVFAEDPAATNGFPIAELGNCADQAACKTYCDTPENMTACIAYGEKKGIISAKDAQISRKFANKMNAGSTPGNCKTKEQCEQFCQNNPANTEQCVAFGEEMGVLSGDELAQAKKVAAALKTGAKLPGGCTGKTTCEAYCADSAHMEECLNFAEAAQILPAAEIAEARQVMKFITSGETPGQCKTKADCNKYCADDTHFIECVDFAAKAGLIGAGELEMAKKTGGKGPGGCKSAQECTAFCNSEANAQTCVDYAIAKGLVTEDQVKMIKEGIKKLRDGLGQVPAEAKSEVETCLTQLLGADKLAKIKAGEKVALTEKQGSGIKGCFEKIAAIMQQKMQAAAGAGAEIPAGIPSGAPANMPSGGMPASPDAAMCAQFKAAPSCDYVPAAVQGLCRQCQ